MSAGHNRTLVFQIEYVLLHHKIGDTAHVRTGASISATQNDRVMRAGRATPHLAAVGAYRQVFNDTISGETTVLLTIPCGIDTVDQSNVT